MDTDDMMDVGAANQLVFPFWPVLDLKPQIGATGSRTVGACAFADKQAVLPVIAVKTRQCDIATDNLPLAGAIGLAGKNPVLDRKSVV